MSNILRSKIDEKLKRSIRYTIPGRLLRCFLFGGALLSTPQSLVDYVNLSISCRNWGLKQSLKSSHILVWLCHSRCPKSSGQFYFMPQVKVRKEAPKCLFKNFCTVYLCYFPFLFLFFSPFFFFIFLKTSQVIHSSGGKVPLFFYFISQLWSF